MPTQTNGRILHVEDLALAKKLPAEFLGSLGLADSPGGVRIPYYGPDGVNVLAVKRRTALVAKEGSWWPAGVSLEAYGQWRLCEAQRVGHVVLVEGESDCWACWYHGAPALGLPGSNSVAATLRAELLEAIETVYVHQEPDRGGATFARSVQDRLRALKYAGGIHVLRMPAGIKDPADLQADSPGQFEERFDAALAIACGNRLNVAVSSLTAEPWDPPIPLSELPAPLPFPIEVFPAGAQEFIREAAWAVNCPPDFVAVPLLAAAGGAIGNTRRLAITRTHAQSACLFAAIVGYPGSGKSPALELILEPFEEAERLFREDWEMELRHWDSASDDPRPVLRRALVDDVTTERLVGLLDENPRGFCMARDELAALVTGLDQYKGGHGHDRQVYLKLWSGASIRVDRKNHPNGMPLIVYRPFVGLIGGLQPAVAERLRGEGKPGQQPPDDGLLDRFLFSFPDAIPAVEESWRELSTAAALCWKDAVSRLLALEMVRGDHGLRPYLHTLSPDGRSAWQRFTREHAAQLNDEAFPLFLRGPWAKLLGYCARLALILHHLRAACGESVADSVVGETIDRAAVLVSYFKCHVRRVYAAMNIDPEVAEAKLVLRWIARNRRQQFKRWEVQNDLRNQTRFQKTEDMEAVLSGLCKRGYLRIREPEQRPGPGRKPDPTYEPHPYVLQENGVNGVFSPERTPEQGN